MSTIAPVRVPQERRVLFRRWHSLGTEKGLKNDADIAGFLLDQYELHQGQGLTACAHCHRPLTLYCAGCQLPASTLTSNAADVSTRPAATSGTSRPPDCRPDGNSDQNVTELLSLSQGELLGDISFQFFSFDETQNNGLIKRENAAGTCTSSEENADTKDTRTHIISMVDSVHGRLKEEMTDGSGHPSDENTTNLPVDGQAVCEQSFEKVPIEHTELREEKNSVKSRKNTVSATHGSSFEKQKNVQEKLNKKLTVCKACDTVFEDSNELKKHIETHTTANDGYFYCSVCGHQSRVQSALKKHLRMHAIEEPLVCGSSNLDMAQTNTLQEHKFTHNEKTCRPPRIASVIFRHSSQLKKCSRAKTKYRGDYSLCQRGRKCSPSKPAERKQTAEKQYRKLDDSEVQGENVSGMKDRSVYCDECGAKSADPSSLKVHMRIHRNERPYVCSDCGVGFRQSCHLINHRRIHTGEKPFKCTECDAAFRRAEELRTHMFKHTGENPYVCEICGMRSASASCLKVHMRIHTDEKRFVCDDCGAAFRQSGQLIQHRRRAHTGEKPYKCKSCDAAFATSGALKVHTITHTGERRYMCEECGAKFPYSSSLKVHMRTHTSDRPYVCNQCGAAFNQPGILSRHLKTHSNERPYMCTVCGSSFAYRPYLKDHMRFHTGERPYACTECDARFHMSSTLKTHMRTHSGEKPYICLECGSAFAESKNLRAHIKTHSGEKPHVCAQCGSRFTVAGSLKIHMRKHTGEKPYLCKQCGAAFALSRDLKKHSVLHKNDSDQSQRNFSTDST